MKLTSVALPPQHLPFQQEQFVRVRKQFKTSINDSQQRARGERSDGRTRKRDEVVGEEEEEEEEGGGGGGVVGGAGMEQQS